MAERFKTPGDAIRLGARIRAARKAQELSLVDVSTRTGVDAGQLSKLERGLMVTLSKNVQKVCTFLRVPVITGEFPQTSAGRRLDELIAALPRTESSVTRLVAAIEEIALSAAARSADGKTDSR